MKSLFFSLIRKTTTFVLATILGISGYSLFAYFSTDKDSLAPEKVHADTELITFDGKLTRIAKTELPTDLDYDAMGVTYILEKTGTLRRIGLNPQGQQESGVYANLATEDTHEEIGFAAIAFHPHFLMTDSEGFGCFYAVVGETSGKGEPDFTPQFGGENEHHQDVVYEYRTNNPFELAFSGDRREVVRLSQPGPDNNLQSLAFDAEGLLYLAVGDGSSGDRTAGSPSKNASALDSAYGKILRIDPTKRESENGQYGIPAKNPFRIAPHAIPELWAYGLRAPHSLSFDPFSNSICIAESGLDGTSEINLCTQAAEHFGWDVCEGSFLYPPHEGHRLTNGVTAPTVEFGAVYAESTQTGSFVYRGERFPTLVGKLVFLSTDGRLMAATTAKSEEIENPVQVLDHGSIIEKDISALRAGPRGEIFVLCTDGDILEVNKTITAANYRKSKKPLVCMVTFLK